MGSFYGRLPRLHQLRLETSSIAGVVVVIAGTVNGASGTTSAGLFAIGLHVRSSISVARWQWSLVRLLIKATKRSCFLMLEHSVECWSMPEHQEGALVKIL